MRSIKAPRVSLRTIQFLMRRSGARWHHRGGARRHRSGERAANCSDTSPYAAARTLTIFRQFSTATGPQGSSIRPVWQIDTALLAHTRFPAHACTHDVQVLDLEVVETGLGYGRRYSPIRACSYASPRPTSAFHAFGPCLAAITALPVRQAPHRDRVRLAGVVALGAAGPDVDGARLGAGRTGPETSANDMTMTRIVSLATSPALHDQAPSAKPRPRPLCGAAPRTIENGAPQSLLTEASASIAALRETRPDEGDVEQAHRRARDAGAGGSARPQAGRRRGAARRQGLRRQLSRRAHHRGPLPVQAAAAVCARRRGGRRDRGRSAPA